MLCLTLKPSQKIVILHGEKEVGCIDFIGRVGNRKKANLRVSIGDNCRMHLLRLGKACFIPEVKAAISFLSAKGINSKFGFSAPRDYIFLRDKIYPQAVTA